LEIHACVTVLFRLRLQDCCVNETAILWIPKQQRL
jgi:hypothetical protein